MILSEGLKSWTIWRSAVSSDQRVKKAETEGLDI
jgi:hypothetical protein